MIVEEVVIHLSNDRVKLLREQINLQAVLKYTMSRRMLGRFWHSEPKPHKISIN